MWCNHILFWGGNVKRQLSLVALAALVGAAGVVIYFADQDPTGQATGQSVSTTMWSELSAFEGSFLKSYRGAFETDSPEPVEVLEAFNELGYAVTGHGGFWRRTVRDQWLGCQANAEIAACKKLEQGLSELNDWDAFQEKMGAVSEAGAKRFLARNHRKMRSYLARYVPAQKNASSMEQTGFFKSHLALAMKDGADMEEDDL